MRLGIYLTMLILANSPTLDALSGEMPDETKYPNIVKPILTISHQTAPEGSFPEKLISPRGAVFDAAGNAWISDCAQNRIYEFHIDIDTQYFRRARLIQVPELDCPASLAFDADNRLYVMNLGTSEIIRLKDGSPDGFHLGGYGTQPGQFGHTNQLFNPGQLVINDEKIYATDPGNNRFQVFDIKTGRISLTVGTGGDGPRAFTSPNGIAVVDGTIIVSDMYNHHLKKFRLDGQPLAQWFSFGSYEGDFAGPAGISSIGSEIFVADAVNHRVQVVDSRGRYLYQFGRHPSVHHEGNGRLHYPMLTAASATAGLVLVCEKFEERCQVFNTETIKKQYKNANDSAWWWKYPYFHYRTSAQILRAKKAPTPPSGSSLSFALTIAGPSGTQTSPSDWMIMSEEELHRVVGMNLKNPSEQIVIGSYGSGDGEFKMPQGAHMDPQGRIWVSDTLNNRVQWFDQDGKLLRTVGTEGSGPLQFNQPGEIVIDGDGTAYILDSGNGRIQVVNRDGNFVRQLGSPGDAVGQLNFPIGITLDAEQTHVLTVELYKARVQSFAVDGSDARSLSESWEVAGRPAVLCHVAVGLDNSAYVTDDALNRVTKFSLDGRIIKQWGRLGTEAGEFYHPQGIAVDEEDRVWILDYGNHRGQVFNNQGEFLFYFGEGQIGSDTHMK